MGVHLCTMYSFALYTAFATLYKCVHVHPYPLRPASTIMARKLKLSILRKNYCRKRKPICMRIPRPKVMVYPVIIPLDCVKLPQTLRVSSLEQLRGALAGLVPNSWSLVDSDATKIVLASVSAQPDGASAAVTFCLMIFEDLSWSLSFKNKPISHKALAKFSRQLTSVSSVVSILHFLDKDALSLICAGNNFTVILTCF